jgi:hypothetical protein
MLCGVWAWTVQKMMQCSIQNKIKTRALGLPKQPTIQICLVEDAPFGFSFG